MKTRFIALLLVLFAAHCVRPANAGSFIASVNTDQARYTPNTAITLYVNLTNNTGGAVNSGTVTLYCKHLDMLVATLPVQNVTLSAGASTMLTFTWNQTSTDFQGYSVEAWARNSGGGTIDNVNTAVDVSSTWTKFPRYGYVSSYPSQSTSTSFNAVWQLKNYHVNAVQFYDWQYKHHVPLAGTVSAPSASWPNLNPGLGSNYRQTVIDYINAAHTYGMSAMNYNLIYGADDDYGNDGVSYTWGLWLDYNPPTTQYKVQMPSGWTTSHIYFLNPLNAAWQNYLIGQEKNVFAAYGFDGWQVDQVGDPGMPLYDFTGNPITVWQTFKPFINAAKTGTGKQVVFNNVGGYGLNDVAANSTEDAVYAECWPMPQYGQYTYNDLKLLIDNAASWSNGKGVMLPAYMDYNYAKTAGFSNSTPGSFSAPGVLLTDAAIFASGGTHLELGDGCQQNGVNRLHMLDNEYFPNHNLLPSASLQATLQTYYDFQVAYENLLCGGFANSGNTLWMSIPSSSGSSANTVWAFTKAKAGTHMINLINLSGENSNLWRDDSANYPPPTTKTNFTVKYYYGGGTVTKLNWASPDAQASSTNPSPGKSYPLTYAVGSDGSGPYVQFTVPRLDYWDLIYLTVS